MKSVAFLDWKNSRKALNTRALLILAALMGCAPPTTEEAYQDFLDSFKGAPALEAQISMNAWLPIDGGEPRLVQETTLNFNVAHPCYGQIQIRGRQLRQADGALVWNDHWTGFLGTGSAVHGFDGLQQTVWEIGPSFESAGDSWPDLAPLKAWAGTKGEQPAQLADILGEDGSRIGFALDFDNYQHRYLLDSDGNWTSGELLPIGQYAKLLPRFEIGIPFLSLKKDARADTYSAQIPKAYMKLSSPPDSSR